MHNKLSTGASLSVFVKLNFLVYIDNALMHGFGGRFSVSNCIYDNIMETIKNNCSCDTLENCTSKSDNTSDCALQEFDNPYDKYLQPKHYCKESCNDQVSKLNSNILEI